MLVVISPAKKIITRPGPQGLATSDPALLSDARLLAAAAKKLSRTKIRQLMKISDDLADLTHARFAALDLDNPDLGNPAVLTFAGDVYRGLDADSLNAKDFAFAQDHLRILSGLYGVLRPLDMMQPYRLEMGRKLKTRRGENLYDFWGPRIAKSLKADMASTGSTVLLNLASNEYFKSVDKAALGVSVVSPVFKEVKDGQARVLGVFAKPARGMMARWVIKNRITDVSRLNEFTVAGYQFDRHGSTEQKPLFTRAQPVAKAA